MRGVRLACLTALSLLAVRAEALLPGGGPEPDVLWLEADNIDGNHNATVVPNNPVCNWFDLTAHHFSATANSPPARAPITCPTYRVNVLNNALSAPALQFDGVQNALTLGRVLDQYLMNYNASGLDFNKTVRFTSFTVVKDTPNPPPFLWATVGGVLWSNEDFLATDNNCAAVAYNDEPAPFGTGPGGYCHCQGGTATCGSTLPCTAHQCSQGRGMSLQVYPYLNPSLDSAFFTANDDLTLPWMGNISPPLESDNLSAFAAAGNAANFIRQTRVVSYVYDQTQPIPTQFTLTTPGASAIGRLWVDQAEQSLSYVENGGRGHIRTHAAGTSAFPRGSFEMGRMFYAMPGGNTAFPNCDAATAPAPPTGGPYGGCNPDLVTPPFQDNNTTIRHFNGLYAAQLFYSRALSTTERQQVEAYLTCKYETGTCFTPIPTPATPTMTPTPLPATPTPLVFCTCTPVVGATPGTMGSCPGGFACLCP